MTESSSLDEVQRCVGMLPGVSSCTFTRSHDKCSIFARVRCNELAGFDAIARCAVGANVRVTLGNSDSNKFRQLEPTEALTCEISFSDDSNDRPTKCEAFGFFAASFLYNASLVDDKTLNELEPIWNARFIRDV